MRKRKSRNLEKPDKRTESNSSYSEFLRHMRRENWLRIVEYNKRTKERKNKRMIEEGREERFYFLEGQKKVIREFMMFFSTTHCFSF